MGTQGLQFQCKDELKINLPGEEDRKKITLVLALDRLKYQQQTSSENL